MKAEPSESSLFAARIAAPSRLADAVTEAIAAAVFDGRLVPGDPLPSEGEIAREFGVSKPIAREALRNLAGAGLVHTQQGKVARVKALNGEPLERFYGFAVRSSLQRLREANEMRLLVETGIARLAARRRHPDGMKAMKSALDDMERALLNPDDFTAADIAFHNGLALATGNTMIRVQMEGLRSVQREVSELFSRRSNRTKEDWAETVKRHRAIFQAIQAGDKDGAERAIVRHYQAADVASFQVAGARADERR